MNSNSKSHILIVDDEPRYIRLLKLILENHNYEVLVSENGETAIEMVVDEEPDLVILDVNMAGMSGFEVCQSIREFSTVPIIMLTARGADEEKIKGLDVGADDYVTKPFTADELLARVRAILRRMDFGNRASTSPIIQAGDLKIDLARHRVFFSEKEIELTPIELQLLEELAKYRGRILTVEHLLQEVWGIGYEGQERVLRQGIYRLRKKIEPDPANPVYIHTKSGVGYIFTSPNQDILD